MEIILIKNCIAVDKEKPSKILQKAAIMNYDCSLKTIN